MLAARVIVALILPFFLEGEWGYDEVVNTLHGGRDHL